MAQWHSSLTPAEERRASDLKTLGMGWSDIGKAMCRSPDTIRRKLDPGFREKRNKQIDEARLRRKDPRMRTYVSSIGNHWVDVAKREIVPDAVVADRDRRLNAPMTLGMALLGDPLPGRSALDRRH